MFATLSAARSRRLPIKLSNVISPIPLSASRAVSERPSRLPTRLLRPLKGPSAPRAPLSTSSSPNTHSAIDFNDTQLAFKSKSTLELLQSYIVFKMCAWRWLVANSNKLLDISKKILGEKLTFWSIKHTFFAHFCAGETGTSIMPTVNKLARSGVGSILDFAAEADVHAKPQKVSFEVTGKAHSELIEEEECESNVRIFLDCITAAAQFEHGFAAVKMTALGRPVLLQRVTEILNEIRRLFLFEFQHTNGEITREQFQQGIAKLGLDIPAEKINEIFDKFDANHSGKIDYLEWTEYLKVEDLKQRDFFTEPHKKDQQDRRPVLACLTDSELAQLQRMMDRLSRIAKAAAAARVRLMIDAEQTYFQPAISHAVLNLQREYNREFPVIFNTYQCYLKDAFETVDYDLQRAEKNGFIFAAKLVRGAYMRQERARAKQLNYEDPIWENADRTHECYNKCMEKVIRSAQPTNVMVASHNHVSNARAVELMKELNIDKKNGGVFFGQLLGMSDPLSFILGHHGYKAYKYVPYGPVKYVIPYLLRRAEENSVVLSGASTRSESDMLLKELKRRLGLAK